MRWDWVEIWETSDIKRKVENERRSSDCLEKLNKRWKLSDNFFNPINLPSIWHINFTLLEFSLNWEIRSHLQPTTIRKFKDITQLSLLPSQPIYRQRKFFRKELFRRCGNDDDDEEKLEKISVFFSILCYGFHGEHEKGKECERDWEFNFTPSAL